MGYSSTYRRKGQTNKEFFSSEFPGLNVLDTSQYGNRVVYIAASPRSWPAEVFALVVSYSWHTRDEFDNYTYKATDETMGPYEYVGCPLRIIYALTPTNSEYAESWRQRVIAWNKRKVGLPPIGSTIELDNPLRFNDGAVLQRFEVCRYRRRGRVYIADNGRRYLISKIKERSYRIVS